MCSTSAPRKIFISPIIHRHKLYQILTQFLSPFKIFSVSLSTNLTRYHPTSLKIKPASLSNKYSDNYFYIKNYHFHYQNSTKSPIKPVLHVDDQGHLVPMESAKGRKKSIEALLKHMEESAIDPQNQRIYISHGDCLDEARALAAMIQERLHVVSVTIGDVGPVIGAHSGLGTLALFFLGTQR